ncbi:Vitamin B12-binding protein [Anaerolineales bacterium]|nr:Vitamin B12-binding protein [Anaerolineales bacterium]
MFRKTLYLTLLIALLLTGCSAPAPTEAPAPIVTEAPAVEEPAATEAPASEEISFTDALGNAITLKGTAQRIVSLSPSVTESLFAIGAGGQMVGRTDYCNYPEEALSLPSVGGFDAATISMESIIALEPDLVIGGSVYQADVIKSVQESGIPAFVSQPADIQGIMDSLTLFGKITGHVDEAAAVVNEMQSRVEAVKKVVAGIPADQRPTVFYEVWHEPLMSANGKTVVGEVIDLAGGVNIFADLPDEYPTVSAEQILDVDPQFIIGPSSHADQMTAEIIGGREGWGNLSAVKNKAIYIVDGDIVSRYSPRIVEVLDEFAKILHPDLFK